MFSFNLIFVKQPLGFIVVYIKLPQNSKERVEFEIISKYSSIRYIK